MIKKSIKLFAIAFATSALLTSCYSYNTVVGNGAQGSQETTSWNHYLLYGLAPVDVSDPKSLAGDTKDYTVNTKQTFVNGLVAALTLGIYTPTTTTITK